MKRPAQIGDRYGAPAPNAPEPIKPLPLGPNSAAPLPRLTPGGSHAQALAPPKIAPFAPLPRLTPGGSNAQVVAPNELSIRPEATVELPTNNPLRPQPNNGQGAATTRTKDAFAAPQPTTAPPLKMELSAPPVDDMPPQPIRMATNETPANEPPQLQQFTMPPQTTEPRKLASPTEQNPLRMPPPAALNLPPITNHQSPITSRPPLTNHQSPITVSQPPTVSIPQPPAPSPQPLSAQPMPAMTEGRPGDRSLEGPQRPSVILEKLPPAAAQVRRRLQVHHPRPQRRRATR